MKVFISHSSSDKWVARQIAAQLEGRGIESFLDAKDIKTGDSIDDAIQSQLADSDELLILLSPASLKSSWVFMEIGGAKALRKRLVPILLHVGPNELPDPLTSGLAREINVIERYYDEVEARSRESTEEREQETRDALGETERATRAAPTPAFKVGDRVRLPTLPPPPEAQYGRDGTYVGWSEQMERYLGEEATVERVNAEFGTVQVDVDRKMWQWSMDWLTAATDDA